jgi:ubiquinone/menaquinone biosynthesis C-methylase UbiE
MKPAQPFLRKLFQFLFWLLYHPLAWSYDLVAAIVSGNRWKNWVYTCLPHISGPKVLEIGPGPGHLLIAMQKKGVFAVGIDPSRQMIHLALRNTTHHHLNTKLINGYAQFLPFPEASFNQVVATFPAEYIFDPVTLAQIFRVLTPGGQFILLPGAWIHSKKPYDRFLAWVFHISGLSPAWPKALCQHLRNAGFEPVCLEENLLESSVVLIIAAKGS